MPERKVYRFRIDPTAKQEAALARYAGARRFVFNWALQRRKETYQQTGKSIPWSELSVELTALKGKPGFEWLKEIDSQLLQQAIADCKKAFDNFFQKRARFPKFKKKHGAQQSFRIPQGSSSKMAASIFPRSDGSRLDNPRPLTCRSRARGSGAMRPANGMSPWSPSSIFPICQSPRLKLKRRLALTWALIVLPPTP